MGQPRKIMSAIAGGSDILRINSPYLISLTDQEGFQSRTGLTEPGRLDRVPEGWVDASANHE